MSGFLLDTNALLWLGLDDSVLRPAARQQLFEAPLFVSAISGVEIAIKASIGIIAQALASGLAVATRDRAFSAYAGLEILEV